MAQNPKARENGKGSVYPENAHGQPTGKWVAALTVDLIDGKPKRIRKFYATRDAAIEGLGDMRGLRDSGVVSSSATVKVYLAHYLSQHLPRRTRGGRQISASTVENYRHVAKRIYKCIGNRRLDRLTATIIEDDLLQPMADNGLSEATISRTLHVLRMCMAHAVRRGELQRNWAEVATIPHNVAAPAERKSLTIDQAKALMAVAAGDRMGAAVVTQLMLGLRPGEVLALKWSDLDRKGDVLQVQRTVKLVDGKATLDDTLKTDWSKRPIRLPAPVKACLKAHKARQKKEQAKAGDEWQALDLMFPTTKGKPGDHANYRRTVRRLTAAADIPGHWTAHEMRHSAISILADQGTPVDDIANLVGHRDRRMIERIYRHRLDTPVAIAAEAMDEIFA